VDKCNGNLRRETGDTGCENKGPYLSRPTLRTPHQFFALTIYRPCNIIAKRLIGGINNDKKDFPAKQYKKEQAPRIQVQAKENAAKKDTQRKKKIGAVNAAYKHKEPGRV
jgi:hypothetical protein